MRRSSLLFTVLIMTLVACAPAAAPTAAPVQPAAPAAQPTQAAEPTKAPAAAAKPTDQPPTPPPAELRPPVSGGGLTPPTLAPTPIGLRPNVNEPRWLTYRDTVFGLAFQYPPDWTFATQWRTPNARGTLMRLSVSRLNQSRGNNAQILIDVRRGSGDLLKWVKGELPRGSLMIDDKTIEGGLTRLTDYNAKLANTPAIFLFSPEHGSGTPDMAELHVASQNYFYQFTYSGDIPDSQDNRTVYLQLLATVTLSGTTTTRLALPSTAFTATS